MKHIYPRLKGIMAERDENVEFVCKLINMNKDTMRKCLKGERSFKLEEVLTLSDYYGIEIRELFKKELN